MRKYWDQREPREKVLIGIAVALFVLLFGWLLVLKPLMAYPKAQKRAYEQASVGPKNHQGRGSCSSKGKPFRLRKRF